MKKIETHQDLKYFLMWLNDQKEVYRGGKLMYDIEGHHQYLSFKEAANHYKTKI